VRRGRRVLHTSSRFLSRQALFSTQEVNGESAQALRLRRIGQLLQGPTPTRSARSSVRPGADRHLRRRHAHRRVRTAEPAPLDAHLASRSFLVGERYSIADIAVYAYSHLAPEPGIDVSDYGHFRAWLDRVTEQDDFLDDLEPYPPNASVVAGKSIYG